MWYVCLCWLVCGICGLVLDFTVDAVGLIVACGFRLLFWWWWVVVSCFDVLWCWIAFVVWVI